jgi:uncharacterized protein (DUF58 family)
MIKSEILARIKRLEIHARRLTRGSMVGDRPIGQKGYGLEFEQLADYNFGDDFRFIDWKSSARMNKMLVKEYREERNRTIILMVDCSGSMFFGSAHGLKYDLVTEIATIFAYVALHAHDSVGLIIFSDSVRTYIEPARGRAHLHTILESLLLVKPSSAKTSLKTALEYVARLKVKNALIVTISDFIEYDFEHALAQACVRSEVIAVRCFDAYEYTLPVLGSITVRDSETGLQTMVHVRKKTTMPSVYPQLCASQDRWFRKYRIDCLAIQTGRPYIDDIVKLLRRRSRS